MDVRRENLEDVRARGVTGDQQARILEFLEEEGGEWSRTEIAEMLRIRLSSVCGRVNELLKAGRLETTSTRNCRVTNARVAVVRITRPVQ